MGKARRTVGAPGQLFVPPLRLLPRVTQPVTVSVRAGAAGGLTAGGTCTAPTPLTQEAFESPRSLSGSSSRPAPACPSSRPSEAKLSSTSRCSWSSSATLTLCPRTSRCIRFSSVSDNTSSMSESSLQRRVSDLSMRGLSSPAPSERWFGLVSASPPATSERCFGLVRASGDGFTFSS